VKLFWSNSKKEAFANKLLLENRLAKNREFIALYKRSLNSEFSQNRIEKMKVLSGYLPNELNSLIVKRYRNDNYNQTGWYRDPLTDWLEELGKGSYDPINLLSEYIGELEKSIFDITNSHYSREKIKVPAWVNKFWMWSMSNLALIVFTPLVLLIFGTLGWFFWIKR
jgi:hypothetical protein